MLSTLGLRLGWGTTVPNTCVPIKALFPISQWPFMDIAKSDPNLSPSPRLLG